jgi:hypothetical protein
MRFSLPAVRFPLPAVRFPLPAVRFSLPAVNGDATAAALSSLCLLHCLLLPVVLTLLPLAGMHGTGHHHGPAWVHWGLLALAIPFSVQALRRGFRRHGDHGPWRLAAVGFALVAVGALAHEWAPMEQLLTVAGGLMVAGAHWWNWRGGAARLAL